MKMRRDDNLLLPRNLIEAGELVVASFPAVHEDGLVVNPDALTAALVVAWIVQAARLQREDPERAAQLRAVFGFDPEVPLFNDDAVLHY